MTANQIEYWKLQETRRHNVVTEQMDIPLKKSQTEANYASINLMQEQAATQETVRAMNLASAAASYATAYAQQTMGDLNIARTQTEQYQQSLLEEKANTERYNQNLTQQRTYGEQIDNYFRYQNNVYSQNILSSESAAADFSKTQTQYEYGQYMVDPDYYSYVSNAMKQFGFKGADVIKAGTETVKIFAK